jgi:hypothetical protein
MLRDLMWISLLTAAMAVVMVSAAPTSMSWSGTRYAQALPPETATPPAIATAPPALREPAPAAALARAPG